MCNKEKEYLKILLDIKMGKKSVLNNKKSVLHKIKRR